MNVHNDRKVISVDRYLSEDMIWVNYFFSKDLWYPSKIEMRTLTLLLHFSWLALIWLIIRNSWFRSKFQKICHIKVWHEFFFHRFSSVFISNFKLGKLCWAIFLPLLHLAIAFIRAQDYWISKLSHSVRYHSWSCRIKAPILYSSVQPINPVYFHLSSVHFEFIEVRSTSIFISNLQLIGFKYMIITNMKKAFLNEP